MSISETMKKFVEKMFGKKDPKLGDYHRCVRCWRRYKYVGKPESLEATEKVAIYDHARFCFFAASIRCIGGKSNRTSAKMSFTVMIWILG